MYKFYEYLCPDGHKFTEFLDNRESTRVCVECHKEAVVTISAPHISSKMGTDPNSSQANRWAKMHKEEAKRQNAKIDPNPSS